MTQLEAAALGVLQGITEFLPVSSSGHLVIAETLLGVKPPGVGFEVALHVGTLLAVLLYFGRDVWLILRSCALAAAAAVRPRAWGRARGQEKERGWRGKGAVDANYRLAWLIIVGTVPAALVGVALRPLFESLFFSPAAVAAMLITTGVLLWLAQVPRRLRVRAASDLGVAEALAIGVLQAAAIAPGLSRSGATIAGGLLLGVERADAARFSFLLSLPAVAGAALLSLTGSAGALAEVGAATLLIGAATAAVSGYVAIVLLLRVLRAGRLFGFAVYCWALGLLLLIAHGVGLA